MLSIPLAASEFTLFPLPLLGEGKGGGTRQICVSVLAYEHAFAIEATRSSG
jgi:hypothetical protein